MPYVSPTLQELPSPGLSIASLSYSSITDLLTPTSSTSPSPTQSSTGHHKSSSEPPTSMLALSLGVDRHQEDKPEPPPIMMFPRRSTSSSSHGSSHAHHPGSANGWSMNGANLQKRAESPSHKAKFLETGAATLVIQPPTPDKEHSETQPVDMVTHSSASMDVRVASPTSYRSPEMSTVDIRAPIPRHRRGRSISKDEDRETAFVRFPQNHKSPSVSRSRSTSPIDNADGETLSFIPRRRGSSEARKAAVALLNLPPDADGLTSPRTSPSFPTKTLSPTSPTFSDLSSTPTQHTSSLEKTLPLHPHNKLLRPKPLNHTASESGASAPAYASLRLKLDLLGKPMFDSATGTFQIVAPGEEVKNPIQPISAPLVRKKSGELVKPSLKTYYVEERLPADEISVYDPTINPKYIGSKSAPTTPSCPKYVHFDTKLERVKLFLAEQKPAAVSRSGSPTGSGDENNSSDFPFPTTSDEEEAALKGLEIRLPNWPARTVDGLLGDVWIESIVLAEDGKHLNGSLFVKNIAFHKRVVVRFTADDWLTTSEVTATYKESIRDGAFDRFFFVIKLQDLMARILEKTIYLALRYEVDGREIWDSNDGKNYQVSFMKATLPTASAIRDGSKTARGSKAVGSQWDVTGRGSSDRMADLKHQLNQMTADEDGNISPPNGISPRFKQSMSLPMSPHKDRAGYVQDWDNQPLTSPDKSHRALQIGPSSPLASRYDFGLSLKHTSKVNSYRSSGWNPDSPRGSPTKLTGSGELPDLMSNASAIYGGATPPSFASPHEQSSKTPPSLQYSRNTSAGMGSPRDLDTFAFASRSIPSQPSDTLAPNPPAPVLTPSGRHHVRGSHSTGDYFSSLGSNVRKTPPTSPRIGLKAIPGGGSELVASRFNTFPDQAGVSRDDRPPWMQPISSNAASLESPTSTSSFTSSFVTPSDSPSSSRGYDPSLTNGGRSGSLSNPGSYASLIDKFCFFTGTADSTPGRNISSASVDSFFSNSPSSGLTTPTATATKDNSSYFPRYPSSPSHSDSEATEAVGGIATTQPRPRSKQSSPVLA